MKVQFCRLAIVGSLISGSVGSAFAHDDSTVIADIAERAIHGVVNISTTQKSRRSFEVDPLHQWFFGGQMPSQRPGQSLGSGVLVSLDGLILTNHHVIKDAESIRVNFADGREMEAEIVGQDPKSDVAVIRLKQTPKDLKPLKLGSSDELRLGETVLAVGNPFGLGHTITRGIVSAKGRMDLDITDYEDFIQTDAAINPGNSGGALLNLKGQLVGINTAIFSRSGGHQGIGFAIPVDMAATIMRSLVTTGRVDRGYLGVGIQALDPRLAKKFQLDPSERGVLINGVGPETPAEKSGLLAGDIILTVDREQMKSPEMLRNTIAMKGSGQVVQLSIWRDATPLVVPVTLGLLPEQDSRAGLRRTTPEKTKYSESRFGLEVSPLNETERRRLGLSPKTSGVLVTGVVPGSRAERGGLRPGDVLTQVNREKIQKPSDFAAALAKTGEDEILLRIHRGQARLYVVL